MCVNINRLGFINIYSVLCPCITDEAKCGYIIQQCGVAITVISPTKDIPFFSVTSVLKHLLSPCCHTHRYSQIHFRFGAALVTNSAFAPVVHSPFFLAASVVQWLQGHRKPGY